MANPIIFTVPNPENPKQQNAVWFEWSDEKNEQASAEKGTPVFDTVLLAHIMGPGQMRSEAVHVVQRKTYDGKVIDTPKGLPAQIKAFLEGDAGTMAGTPLNELAVLDRGVVATLKAMGIHSIEALANSSDAVAQNIMGYYGFKQAAQAFIDVREGQAPIGKLTAELEAANKKIAERDTLINDLAARLSALEDKASKKKAA